MNNQEKNELLEELLIEISNDTNLNDITKYVEKFNIVYKGDFRHEYSTITRVLFSIKNIDGRDVLTEKIKFIEEKISGKDITIKIDKLWDHINLENIRMANLNKISKDVHMEVDSSKKVIEKIVLETEKASSDLIKIQGDLKNNSKESITILSIFSGVVMAFAGGMSFITHAMTGINKVGPYRLSVFILLIGLVMFNTVFLLLYMIGKLTDKYVGSECECSNPKEGCTKKKSKCCIKRYPYIIWFNLISIILIAIILILYFIDRYNLLTRFIDLTTQLFPWSKLSACIISIILLLVPFVLFGIIIYKMINIKCDNKKQ